jgi:2-polyprenyl-6-methoxyphenol hydroxylase-like FAD-dependent oxidoreductase
MALRLAEPFRSAVLWMPDDTKVSFDRMVYWVTVPWDSRQGRVTLVGDAAHPMAPCKSLRSFVVWNEADCVI